MSTTGVGIIGCGWVAQEHIKAFQNDERSQVRALVSRNPASAERCRDLHNLDCSIGADADEMLKQDDIDIVVVCTPHNTHTQYVVAAEQGKAVMLADLES